MANPSVVATATLTFGGTTYKLKSVLGGKPQTCDAIDVSCCDDTRKQFVHGALVANGEINATVAGDAAPQVNSVSALTIALGATSVSCGDCVCKSAEPSTIEVGGNREYTWDCTFQPCGAAPASNGGAA